jgi:hypothetical protein
MPNLYKQTDKALNLIIFKKEYDLEQILVQNQEELLLRKADSNILKVNLKDYP